MPSLLQSFGYIVLKTDQLAEWEDYGQRVLGLMLAQKDSSLSFRMDDRALRWLVTSEVPETALGFEVASRHDLDELAKKIEKAGVKVAQLTSEEAKARFVEAGIAFHDPAGNRIEAFINAQTTNEKFVPGHPHSGFRTGAMGMGHAVLHVKDMEIMKPFVEELLGFSLTDYAFTPFKARFYHLNQRHHSLAMIETGKTGIHHIMLEFNNLDDVGQAYDIGIMGNHIGTTLGRHTNDFVTSYYATSPSGFLVELGFGGRVLEPETWEPKEMKYGPSLWGHDRNWLPPAAFKEAQAIRSKAQQEGLRLPVQVADGNYQIGPGPAPWWEG